MAKLQHTFVQGKMNKDLDERLLPNGQYRDAQNIQVSTSESSDVGAVENILGNTIKNLRSTGPNVFWATNFGMQQTPTCVGVIKDSQNEKIYWFLATDPDGIEPTSAIVEFDQTTGIVAPILVDVNNVLNFNGLNLITGVNILEGLLYWTDNLNEPKVINIATFKAGSTDFLAQTHVYGATRDFIESDVTVITATPEDVLTATAFPSLIGGFGTGITPITTTDENFGSSVVTDVVNISWLAQPITPADWTNKRAVLTAEVVQEDETVDKYQVTGQFAGTILSLSADLTIESISSDTPNTALPWTLLLIEDEPIFKNDFPRFSYRYKYTDSRYSTYAPFSLATFVPGKFEYLSRDGFNQGMDDVTRKITLGNFPTLPADVVEIEILYKGSRSTNIYIIETFSATDTLALDITSGVLGPIVESAQLLRLFDNVPRKALAQEIIGNRIVYGNYLQNYDVTASSINFTASAFNDTHTDLYNGVASIKTDRDYQLGVSFLDDFGRESPVFTTNNATVSFDQANSANVNKIEPVLSASTPALSTNGGWATNFKYYIKNNTPEYYNLALDRFYNAEDGSVWLSFPSAERNKVSEGQYIRLKKQHDTSVPVTINNRYKINGIENEAPEYLTNVRSVIAKVNGLADMDGIPGFILGNNEVTFLGPTRNNNENFFNSFGTDSFIQFLNSTGGGRSAIYSILEGGPNGSQETVVSATNPSIDGDYNIFGVTLSEGIKNDDIWLTNLDNEAEIKIVIYEKVQRPLPEFQGRFFVKINPDAAFTDNVAAAFSAGVPETVLDTTLQLTPNISSLNTSSPAELFLVGWSYQNPSAPVVIYKKLPATGDLDFQLNAGNYSWSDVESDAKARKFTDKFVAGASFKFEYSDGTTSAKPYTIVNVIANIDVPNTPGFLEVNNYSYTLDRPFDDTQGAIPGAPTINELVRMQIFRERITGDQEVLSSQNPAIFETESDELADIELYYEASNAIPASQAGVRFQYLDWFNCYSFGNGVESDRIRDDYNATIIGKGVRVSSTLDEPYAEERLGSQIIFSGIFNSISGTNNTNQFLTAQNITKTLNPVYGTLQKLHARDTDLIALCEDKCFKILANKDALYNADGSTNVTANSNVLGQTMPFVGEYGISKNPESFATFGFRAYFTDKSRGVVMRLSRDGLTEISDKGMSFFFQDGMKSNVNPNIMGAYDADIGSYNVVLNGESISYKERVDGWNTRMSYDPEAGVSLNNEYYTFKNGELYEHSNATRSNFYGTQYNTTVTPIFNDAPTSVKNFKTLSYEGDEGWTASIVTNKQSGTVSTWKEREGIFFNYIMGDATTLSNIDAKEFSVQGLGNVLSHVAASTTIVINGEINVSLQTGDIIYSTDPTILRTIGTVLSVDRVTNSIVLVATVPGTAPVPGDFMLFAKDSQVNTSGLIGYYGETVLTTSSPDKKELFAINSEVFISSE